MEGGGGAGGASDGDEEEGAWRGAYRHADKHGQPCIDIEVQVMESRKTKLGEKHPSTLTSMNNLAFTWKGQGREAKATHLMDKWVQSRERVLGINHADTFSSSDTVIGWRSEAVSVDDVSSIENDRLSMN